MNKLLFAFAVVFLCWFTWKVSDARAEVVTGKASWYSSEDSCGKKTNNLKGCPTASGEGLHALEKEKKDFAASWKFPLGQRVKVCNEENEACVKVRILDRGPSKKYPRIIDLGKNSFAKIAPLDEGLIRVTVEKI